MTSTTKLEDKENQQRPRVTDEEFAEFLTYVDDLTMIRLRWDEEARFLALFFVGGWLWAFGMGFRLIDFEFGLFYAACVGLTCVAMLWWKLRSKCPRCKQRFGTPFIHQPDAFGFRTRSSPASETCRHCGLRALSQYDVTRFLNERRAVK